MTVRTLKSVILGIGACSHDSGAAIIVDNTLVAACEEERFTRLKHDWHFPTLSIEFCLKRAGVSRSEVDFVAIGWHPTRASWRRLAFLFNLRQGWRLWRKAAFLRGLLVQPFQVAAKLRGHFPRAKVLFVEHHLAHAASAFFCSPFEEAAILTLDGRGEWSTGLMAVGSGNRVIKINEQYFPQSLGLVYTAVTHYLGFEDYGEYKLMGLSSYGEPEYQNIFRNIFRFDAKKMFEIDISWIQHPSFAVCPWGDRYYSDRMVQTFGPPREKGEPITRLHQNVAKSLQRRLEEVGIELARELRRISGKKYLAMAGGVCLNGLMNYAIKATGLFEKVFVHPAANDGGISLGTALYVNHHILGSPRNFTLRHAYWGPDFSRGEILRELENSRLTYGLLRDPARVGAELIAHNRVIGWFQGRSELGPRALGNRSILADPRSSENKDRVNARIKFREEFCPFAPSVLEEMSSVYFNGLGQSPYMSMICPAQQGAEQTIPAVIHIDRTARPQTVDRETNPRFHSLIKYFYQITGVPVVLNTSFNVKGEPIVNSPQDALRCFFATGLDYLILGDFLVSKGPIPEELRAMASPAG